jgi:hypothetical protein
VHPILVGVPLVFVWASWIPSRDSKFQVPSFGEKLPWYFPDFIFVRKQTKTRLLLNTTLDLAVLSKYDEILEKIFEQSVWTSRYI